MSAEVGPGTDILKYAADEDIDILVYCGPVERRGYERLCEVLKGSSRRKNVLMVMCTYGGDAHAGYRIARALHHNYPSGAIRLLAPDQCKSAGTLVCIGANELIIADEGELGPLDVQVAKPDEMFASGSGLDIMRGLSNLRLGVLESFKDYLLEINAGSGVSTKMAAEVATRLAVGTYEPVFAQIDPIRLGEMEAALSIANAYGKRLAERSKNLKPDALSKLVNSYPSHNFVIDRKEARGLFQQVRCPTEVESSVGTLIKSTMWKKGDVSPSSLRVLDLVSVLQSAPKGTSIERTPDAKHTSAATKVARKRSSSRSK